jgi:carboxymethylenebutenolidase
MYKSEIDSLLPDAGGASRRAFGRTAIGAGIGVGVGVGVGFAAAALPVLAQTLIKTDTTGLTVGEVTIDVAGFKMPAYRAMPAGKASAPVILVISEIFGVHEYIADVARRLAKQGYMAIAPELFARHGDPGSYGEIAKLIAEVVSKVTQAQLVADLDATVAWAKAQGADTTRLGITGFCWGGQAPWVYAAHNPALKAGVAWYGPLARSLAPGDLPVIDLAPRIKAPILGLYGAADGGIPNDTVDRMRAALSAAGNTRSEIVLYPDTPHAFHADYRPTYRKAQAEDGWKRCLAWFSKNGV